VNLPINNEAALARLAIDLGAVAVGGPLAADEERLVTEALRLPAAAASAIDAARMAIGAGHDPLGAALVSLRSPTERRNRGQLYTPAAILKPMVAWAMAHHGVSRFVDPGCGSGRYAAAAARARSDLEIVAIDLDPLATLLTRATLAVLEPANCRVLCDNYLTADFGATTGRTAWVGNPPYVRHHELSAEVKAWAARAAEQVGYPITGRAGLHALFFLATVRHGKAGDIGSFVTSAEWLDVGYGSIVRSLFVNGMGGRALDLIDPKAIPFEDAMTTALITCFELAKEPSDVAIHLVNTPAELPDLEGGKRVATSELVAQNRWSPLFRDPPTAARNGQMLGDVVRVHRGFATGSNRFFLMTKQESEARGLTDWVRPAITSAAEIVGADGVIRDTPERKVLLDLPADLDRAAHPAVDAYLAEGEAAGIDQRYLCTHRQPWFRVGPMAPAPIVATYMARQAPLFALNPDRLLLLNIGHGLYPKSELTPDELRALAASLNDARSQFSGSGRTYFGGLEKFEPREMESLLLPEPA
jgi:hypothetical protein